jgi:hypothetical protein
MFVFTWTVAERRGTSLITNIPRYIDDVDRGRTARNFTRR